MPPLSHQNWGRGFYSCCVPYCLKALGFSPRSTRKILPELSRAALVGSYHIWLARNDTTWTPDAVRWEPTWKIPKSVTSSSTLSSSSAATSAVASPCVNSPPVMEPSVTTGAAEHHEPAAPAAVDVSFINDPGSSSSHSQSSSQNIDFTINSGMVDAATVTHPIVVDLTSSPDHQELPEIINLSSPQEVSDLLPAITPQQLANTLECESSDNLLLPAVNTSNFYDEDRERERSLESPSSIDHPQRNAFFPPDPLETPCPSQPSSLPRQARSYPPPGLVNLGATCNVNAILNCLFFLPELWKTVPLSLSDTPMLKNLRAILIALNSSICSVKPKKFVDSLETHIASVKSKAKATPPPKRKLFSFNRQHDGFEVLGYILEEMQRAYQSPDLLSIGISKLPTCLACMHDQNVKTVSDPFLTIPFANSIVNSIRKYYGEQVNQRCWHCKTNQDCSVTMTFTNLPKILILHVNRSNFDKDKRELPKSMHRSIVTNKDICHPLGSNGPSIAYKLSSVIHHTGTPVSGHYIATLCDPATKRM